MLGADAARSTFPLRAMAAAGETTGAGAAAATGREISTPRRAPMRRVRWKFSRTRQPRHSQAARRAWMTTASQLTDQRPAVRIVAMRCNGCRTDGFSKMRSSPQHSQNRKEVFMRPSCTKLGRDRPLPHCNDPMDNGPGKTPDRVCFAQGTAKPSPERIKHGICHNCDDRVPKNLMQWVGNSPVEAKNVTPFSCHDSVAPSPRQAKKAECPCRRTSDNASMLHTLAKAASD